VILYPNCKINLGLRILRKRTDGFHDLETVFYPIPFYDVLEMVKMEVHSKELPSVAFSTSGLSINGYSNDNLCIKAYELLQKDLPDLPPVQIHLHKTIPIGAGLGGGSADAAFALLLLNKKFHLQLSTTQLIGYALQLGSDCPFFIINQPCFATGRGETMERLNINLSTYKFILVNPGIHVPTAKAFAGIVPGLPAKSVKEIIQQPVHTWKDELINDFEKTIFSLHPEIGKIKKSLYDNGAIYASMSGSGSTVYGIFEKDAKIEIDFPLHYLVKELVGQP
jgi:4-diphosphocytidyl-2-C-methyl-D-erythritol kinase